MRATTTSSARIPTHLNSYALFGEAYYNITPELKLTGGLRWTDDQKHFVDIPSELLVWAMAIRSKAYVDQLEQVHRPRRRELDAETSLHRSKSVLCIVCPWL